jgi:hypothetical protein
MKWGRIAAPIISHRDVGSALLIIPTPNPEVAGSRKRVPAGDRWSPIFSNALSLTSLPPSSWTPTYMTIQN